KLRYTLNPVFGFVHFNRLGTTQGPQFCPTSHIPAEVGVSFGYPIKPCYIREFAQQISFKAVPSQRGVLPQQRKSPVNSVHSEILHIRKTLFSPPLKVPKFGGT